MNGEPSTNKRGNGASPLSWSQRGLLGGGLEVADVWLFRAAGSHSGDLVAELQRRTIITQKEIPEDGVGLHRESDKLKVLFWV